MRALDSCMRGLKHIPGPTVHVFQAEPTYSSRTFFTPIQLPSKLVKKAIQILRFAGADITKSFLVVVVNCPPLSNISLSLGTRQAQTSWLPNPKSLSRWLHPPYHRSLVSPPRLTNPSCPAKNYISISAPAFPPCSSQTDLT